MNKLLPIKNAYFTCAIARPTIPIFLLCWDHYHSINWCFASILWRSFVQRDRRSGHQMGSERDQMCRSTIKFGPIIHPHPKPENEKRNKIKKTSTFYSKQSLKNKFVLSELKMWAKYWLNDSNRISSSEYLLLVLTSCLALAWSAPDNPLDAFFTQIQSRHDKKKQRLFKVSHATRGIKSYLLK